MTAALAFATAIVLARATGASIAAIANVTVVDRAKAPMSPQPQSRRSNRHGVFTWASSPSVFPPPQDLSFPRQQRAEDRLQGCAAAAALRFRARQDRAEPDHRSLRQETAGARPSHQAGTFSRTTALCDQMTDHGGAATRSSAAGVSGWAGARSVSNR